MVADMALEDGGVSDLSLVGDAYLDVLRPGN